MTDYSLSCEFRTLYDTWQRWRLLLLVLLQLLLSPYNAHAETLPSIYWNSTNPIFRIDNTDHVLQVQILDRLNLVCPYIRPGARYGRSEVQHSRIYSVSEWSYKRCVLTDDAKLVGTCDDPYAPTMVTTVFRQFTPLPGGLEFQPGNSYYFITTSTGTKDGLLNRQGGLCAEKNMKIKFEVLYPPGHPNHPAGNRGGAAVIEGNSIRSSHHRRRGDSNELDTSTPVMYIVHTRPPGDEQDHDDDAYLQGYRRPYEDRRSLDERLVRDNAGRTSGDKSKEEDDDDDAAELLGLSRWLLTECAALLLLLRL